MIRKLRLKIVGISVIAVAVLLVSVLAAVALSTRSQMVRASESRLQEALAGHMLSSAQPGSGGGQPCFVADIYADGTVRLAGSGYYDLDNDALILSIVQDALQRESREGVLQDYALRYMRQTGTLTVRLAFTDCSQEQATMRSLLLRMGGVSLAALLLLTGVSYWLAGFAVKPVQQAWQEQKQFVSDASHELKTPLTVILTNAELLQEPEYDEQARSRFVDSIMTMSHQMRGLVESLLELARVDNGGQNMVFSRLNFSELVSDALLPFEPVYFEKGLTLESNVEENLFVKGSQQHLKQVADILLDNASKYASADSTVRVILRRQGSHCLLSVASAGDAISKEDLKNIFKRFYRMDKARSMNHSYGLGLSIADSIVSKHGGKIWAESADGVNTFFVQLPTA